MSNAFIGKPRIDESDEEFADRFVADLMGEEPPPQQIDKSFWGRLLEHFRTDER